VEEFSRCFLPFLEVDSAESVPSPSHRCFFLFHFHLMCRTFCDKVEVKWVCNRY
jgi:hypothetical protein